MKRLSSEPPHARAGDGSSLGLRRLMCTPAACATSSTYSTRLLCALCVHTSACSCEHAISHAAPWKGVLAHAEVLAGPRARPLMAADHPLLTLLIKKQTLTWKARVLLNSLPLPSTLATPPRSACRSMEAKRRSQHSSSTMSSSVPCVLASAHMASAHRTILLARVRRPHQAVDTLTLSRHGVERAAQKRCSHG